jgi:hypothetical protein
MMMRAATEILFSRRVTLTEHYWVTFRERRSTFRVHLRRDAVESHI